MKNDERVVSEVKLAKSIGYTIFWFGIFIVLLYRWFILNQTLMDTLDFFLVWITASLSQFFALAVRGIPITYPVSSSKKELGYFMYLFPLLTATLSSIIIFLRVGSDINRILTGFIFTYSLTLVLFLIYKALVQLWEKRNI